MTSVLITRPRAATEHLANRLEKIGYEAVIEPLLSIAGLHESFPENLVVDAVMITSGNALTALEGRDDGLSQLLGLPCFCVGPRTAEKASIYGFKRTHYSGSDGIELARLIANAFNGRKASILHIAGRNIDSKAGLELCRLGCSVTLWPVYEAIPMVAFSPPALVRLRKGPLDAVVVFSPRTAKVLAGLLATHALETCCAGLAAICLSGSVADVLKPLGWRQILAPLHPTEDAVIDCLHNICPVKS